MKHPIKEISEERSEFSPLNLDCLTTDPKEMDEIARTLKLLWEYADRKAGAMRCRKAGNVEQACELEASCERKYKALPEWAKW